MSTGSAFAAGINIPSKVESLMPLLNYEQRERLALANQNRGIATPSSVGSGLSDRMRNPEADARWSAENQIRSQNAGVLPSQQEIAAQNAGIAQQEKEAARQFEMEKLDKAQQLERERMRTAADEQQFQRGITLKEQGRAEKASRIAQSQDIRAGQEHRAKMTAADLAIDKEKRILDHKNMMMAFMSKDPMAVSTWFLRNGPKAADGSQKIPFFEVDDKGNWLVDWPGSKEGAVPMNEDDLARLLQSLSPQYETPKSEMERANIEATKRKGGINVKDMEELRQKQAKNISDSTAMSDNPVDYEGAYSKLGGGIFNQENRKVARTGMTKSGLKAVQYDDGQIEYYDPKTGQRVR
jgi:hypothetical protein